MYLAFYLRSQLITKGHLRFPIQIMLMGLPSNPDFDPNQPAGPDNEENIPDPANVVLIDNPETEAQFANRMVRQFLLDNVKSYEINVAKQQAAEAASVNAESVTISDPAV